LVFSPLAQVMQGEQHSNRLHIPVNYTNVLELSTWLIVLGFDNTVDI